MSKAKVVQLTTVHSPTDTRVFYRTARTLADAGYEVVLIAPGAQDRVVDGVRLRGLPQPASRTARATTTARLAYRAALDERAAVYQFHDPELIPLGLLLKRRTGAKVIYDAHEDIPATIANKHWLAPALRRSVAALAGRIEQAGAARLDAVVAATPDIAAKFPRSCTVVIQNFAAVEEMAAPGGAYDERPPLFVYAGRISRQRGALEMVQAAGLAGARLALAGNFAPPALQHDLAALPGWELIDFVGWQSRQALGRLFARARAGLVTLHPVQQYLNAFPVKLFEYMAAGLPVIASDFPLLRHIVGGAGCGLLVDPLSSQAIAGAMRWLLENPATAQEMGQRGRQAALARYNWDSEAVKLLRLYADLLVKA